MKVTINPDLPIPIRFQGGVLKAGDVVDVSKTAAKYLGKHTVEWYGKIYPALADSDYADDESSDEDETE